MTRLRYRILPSVLAAALTLPLLTGCGSAVWEVQAFNYPPGSRLEEGDWQYSLQVETSTTDSFVEKSRKSVRLEIVDGEQKQLMFEELEVECYSVEATASWSGPERVDVRLYDGASSDAETAQSLLVSRSYRYDKTAGRFIGAD